MDYTGYNFTSKLHNDTYDLINTKYLDLSGKSVLITGASRGVGKAMAISYAKAGASTIILTARTPLDAVADEISQAATTSARPVPRIITHKCDSTNVKDVETTAAQLTTEVDSIDVLINNAGYLEDFKPIIDSDPEEWWKTFEVNVKGVYLITRSFLPLVLKSTSKTIIQVSSIGAHAVLQGASSYQTTKLAVIRFNNFLVHEYADQGLLAYSIHPGGVMTELASNMPKETHDVLIDTPELCGDCVAWLTSERREWLSDRYVSVTWDMEELLGMKEDIVKKDLLQVRLRL